jgi:hypothetical protein
MKPKLKWKLAKQNYFKDTGLVIDEAGKADLHALE